MTVLLENFLNAGRGVTDLSLQRKISIFFLLKEKQSRKSNNTLEKKSGCLGPTPVGQQ
jgi:hypothetical protein